MDDIDIFEKASPEWIAKRYIIEVYFYVAGLEASAYVDPTLFPRFRAGVRKLYRIMRVKMWEHRKKLGLSEEKLKLYDSYMFTRKKLKRAAVVEWFNDIQLALEKLGYTRFERSRSIEDIVKASRE